VKKIVCKISHLELITSTYADFIVMFILGKLRDAGIPVKGIFTFQGIERGTLNETRDFMSSDLLYTWTEELCNE